MKVICDCGAQMQVPQGPGTQELFVKVGEFLYDHKDCPAQSPSDPASWCQTSYGPGASFPGLPRPGTGVAQSPSAPVAGAGWLEVSPQGTSQVSPRVALGIYTDRSRPLQRESVDELRTRMRNASAEEIMAAVENPCSCSQENASLLFCKPPPPGAPEPNPLRRDIAGVDPT